MAQRVAGIAPPADAEDVMMGGAYSTGGLGAVAAVPAQGYMRNLAADVAMPNRLSYAKNNISVKLNISVKVAVFKIKKVTDI